MSKIAEQKSLGEYPKINHPYSTDVEREIDAKRAYYRTAYIVGYDQAMQDFLERACTFLKNRTMAELCLDSESTELVDDFIEDFKDYMQDE